MDIATILSSVKVEYIIYILCFLVVCILLFYKKFNIFCRRGDCYKLTEQSNLSNVSYSIQLCSSCNKLTCHEITQSWTEDYSICKCCNKTEIFNTNKMVN